MRRGCKLGNKMGKRHRHTGSYLMARVHSLAQHISFCSELSRAEHWTSAAHLTQGHALGALTQVGSSSFKQKLSSESRESFQMKICLKYKFLILKRISMNYLMFSTKEKHKFFWRYSDFVWRLYFFLLLLRRHPRGSSSSTPDSTQGNLKFKPCI